MEKEKLIEEMAREMCHLSKECETCKICYEKYNADESDVDCYFKCTAKLIIGQGYRKERQGEWIKHGNKWKCSHCGVLMNIDGTPTENMLFYCPNCGAKMKGAE